MQLLGEENNPTMANESKFQSIFGELQPLMARYASGLTCVVDTETEYSLDTKHIMKNKKPLFFGAVKIGKRYVSYHLMPVYVEPGLLKGMSAKLRKRMQGKSCFNFREVDQALFRELAELTAAGYRSYKSAGYA